MFKNKFLKSPIYLFLAMILILLLILSFTSYGEIDVLMPTGNIDIYEIIINKSDCEECEKCDTPVFNDDNAPTNNPSDNPNNDDVPTDVPEDVDDNRLTVFDEKGNFSSQENLNIFSNPAFEMKSIIAPGSNNAYQFVVRNGNNFNIQYSIKMNETNKYNINMKYRLKQNGKYIIGNEDTWVTANKLIIEKIKLPSKSNIPYILEWKWFESNHDTEIGKIDDANYKLSIQVMAESI